MEGFRIYLKKFLGLALYSLSEGDNLRPKSPKPIYSTTVLFDTLSMPIYQRSTMHYNIVHAYRIQHLCININILI